MEIAAFCKATYDALGVAKSVKDFITDEHVCARSRNR